MYLSDFQYHSIKAIESLDNTAVESAINVLSELKSKDGRLFILGVGGSAANASHAVNDFRKIAGIEAYSPVDNVSELTALINDEGWDSVFVKWLQESKLNNRDILLLLSVGGGDREQNLSVNLIHALDYSNQMQAKSIAIVGKSNGYCLQHCNFPIALSIENNAFLTPIAEAMQGFVLHAMVSHPKIKSNQMTWESRIND